WRWGGFFVGLLLGLGNEHRRAGVGDNLRGFQLRDGRFLLFEVCAAGAVLFDEDFHAVGWLRADAEPVLNAIVIQQATTVGQRDRRVVAAQFFDHAAIARGA